MQKWKELHRQRTELLSWRCSSFYFYRATALHRVEAEPRRDGMARGAGREATARQRNEAKGNRAEAWHEDIG